MSHDTLWGDLPGGEKGLRCPGADSTVVFVVVGVAAVMAAAFSTAAAAAGLRGESKSHHRRQVWSGAKREGFS